MKELINVTKSSGIPLIGCIAFGIIDRGTNLLQVRCTSICNMNCIFCSTSANDPNIHPINYIVNIDYLIEEVKRIISIKQCDIIVFLDSVGEPLTHPDFISLITGLKKIKKIKKIIAVTNGTLLTKSKVIELEKAGLDQINISLHSLDPEKSKFLFGNPNYDIDKVMNAINYISKSSMDLMLTPVCLPCINDNDIEEIIKYSTDIGCKIGLQKYELYKYSKRLKGVKQQNYWKFYRRVKELEDKYNIKLKAHSNEIKRCMRIPEVFKKNDRTHAIVKCKGWLPNQMIAVARNVCISVNNCNAKINSKIRIKILETNNNLYLADLIT
ncbi:radical SAM protein [Candidatus Woesearchaeota archaeon]|nr:radical SAM protein [Candidatus Woesearchaeota archaeon]